MTLIIATQGTDSYIAADRCATYGHMKQEVRKIEALTLPNGDRYLAAYAGDVALGAAVFEALRQGLSRAEIVAICKCYDSNPLYSLGVAAKVPFKDKEGVELASNSFEIYVILNDGSFHRRMDDFFAMGSGADFAYGYAARTSFVLDVFNEVEKRLTNVSCEYDQFFIKGIELVYRNSNATSITVTDWPNIYGD